MDKKPDYIILTKTEEAGNSRIALNPHAIQCLEDITFHGGHETRIYMNSISIDVNESINEILNLSKATSVGLTN